MNISDLFTRVDRLSVDQTRKLMDEEGEHGPVLLDVREPSEYEKGHIPGAINIPRGLVEFLYTLHTFRRMAFLTF